MGGIMITINEIGLQQILDFLAAKHRRQDFTQQHIENWALAALMELDKGTPPRISIHAADSVTGRAVDMVISDDGLSEVEIQPPVPEPTMESVGAYIPPLPPADLSPSLVDAINQT